MSPFSSPRHIVHSRSSSLGSCSACLRRLGAFRWVCIRWCSKAGGLPLAAPSMRCVPLFNQSSCEPLQGRRYVDCSNALIQQATGWPAADAHPQQQQQQPQRSGVPGGAAQRAAVPGAQGGSGAFAEPRRCVEFGKGDGGTTLFW